LVDQITGEVLSPPLLLFCVVQVVDWFSESGKITVAIIGEFY